MDSLLTKYDNILLLGNFNSERNEEAMSTMCQINNLKRKLTVVRIQVDPHELI